MAAFHILVLKTRQQGSAWIRQFISGFPLVGTLSQLYTYPPDEKAGPMPAITPDQLFASARARFDERDRTYGKKHTKVLLEEATAQQIKGWITPFST